MKVKSLLCGLVCLCLLSGCSGQPEQGTESSKQENITTSSSQTETTKTTTAPTTAVEEKHSSPEKAIEEFCRTYSSNDTEACKKIVPPDFLYYQDLNSNESTNDSWNPNNDKIEIREFKQNIKLEKGEEMYEWYMNYYTAIKSTNAEKITFYTTSAIVDWGDGEEIMQIDFFCVLENGKWYAVLAD